MNQLGENVAVNSTLPPQRCENKPTEGRLTRSSHTLSSDFFAALTSAVIAAIASVISLTMPLHLSWMPLAAGVAARVAMLLRQKANRHWYLASALLGTWLAERGIGKMMGIDWKDGSLGHFLVQHTGWEADAILIVTIASVLIAGQLLGQHRKKTTPHPLDRPDKKG